MGSMRVSIAETFLRYFDVSYAASEAQKRAVYGIRYSVYCDEFGYEPRENFPDHEEKDEFDLHAHHALISHKSSGLPAGCVRLVKPGGEAGEGKLPFEKYCAESLDVAAIEALSIERNRVCEISRLAVDSTFRRRAGERITRFGGIEGLDCSKAEQRSFSLIAVSCFLAATALTDLSGRDEVFAMMEPFLPRLMGRSGINFQKVGHDIDYHGTRAPYFITTQMAQDNMLYDLKELYLEIHKLMTESFDG